MRERVEEYERERERDYNAYSLITSLQQLIVEVDKAYQNEHRSLTMLKLALNIM